MNKEIQDSIEGKYVYALTYRGNNVVSILLKDSSSSRLCSLSINLIGCTHFQDDGIVGNTIVKAGTRPMTMVHIYLLQRQTGNGKEYHTYDIIDNQNNRFSALVEKIIVSDDVQLFNPLSEEGGATH